MPNRIYNYRALEQLYSGHVRRVKSERVEGMGIPSHGVWFSGLAMFGYNTHSLSSQKFCFPQ
jgi:hypothetical protein